MNFCDGSTGLLQAAAIPTTNISCDTRLISPPIFDSRNRGQRAKLVPQNNLRLEYQKPIFTDPEYVPKHWYISISRIGAYIATSKEEPQR